MHTILGVLTEVKIASRPTTTAGFPERGTVDGSGIVAPLNPASVVQLEELLKELLPDIDLCNRLSPTAVIA